MTCQYPRDVNSLHQTTQKEALHYPLCPNNEVEGSLPVLVEAILNLGLEILFHLLITARNGIPIQNTDNRVAFRS